MDIDQRKTKIGFLSISVSLLCQVVHQGHQPIPETMRTEAGFGLEWRIFQCSLCHTWVFLPRNQPPEPPLVQIEHASADSKA